MGRHANRRDFLRQTTAGGLGLWAGAGLGTTWGASPNEKLNIAIVGAGGMGRSHVEDAEVVKENVVALCDIDENNLAGAAKIHPKAALFNDFRKMLDVVKNVDAVICATPDHTHAVVTAMALRMGKHVYTQKPLTHTVYEAHVIADLAAKNPKLATQMGNQGHSNEGARQVVELVRAGVVGPIREVHAWTDRPIWPQSIDRPKDTPEVPKRVHWDLWIGPAPERPYHPAYHPFAWRGWWDFGTGALGDMACHVADTAFWALDLRHPTSIEARAEGVKPETAPKWSVITYEFPARGEKPPVKFTWYDGGKKPSKEYLKGLSLSKAERDKGKTEPEYDANGSLLVGEKGIIYLDDAYGARYKLLPEKDFEGFVAPPKTLTRSPGHMKDWIDAAKNGTQACSNFDYASALTGMVLLGNLALRAGKKLDWDAANMRATNAPEVDEFIRPEYRKGWTL